jgi:hypothetical protein
MKVVNICAAVLALFAGVITLVVSLSASPSEAGIVSGIGLLVTALLFGTLSAGLELLEQIRDGMRCMVSSLPAVPE